MSKQFCSECGYEITEPSKFCPSCGHPVAEPTSPIQQVHTTPPQQQVIPVVPTEQTSQGNKPNNNNKLFAIIAGVIIIGLFVFFWQKDAPEDVAEKFFGHIMEFDVQKAEKLVSSKADDSVKEGFSELSEGLDVLPIELSGQMKLKHSFKVLNVKKDGSTATVHAEISFLDGMYEDEGYFELIKEAGKWKILNVE